MCWIVFRAFRLRSYMSWINFPNDILVELSTKYSASQSSPHMTFAKLLIKYASEFKVVCVVWPFIEENLQFLIHYKQKIILQQPTNAFFLHWWHLVHWQSHTMVASCSLAKPYNGGITKNKCLASPRSHTPMYTTFGLFAKICNIMLSLDKLLCKIPQWCITFITFMNAHANFTRFYL